MQTIDGQELVSTLMDKARRQGRDFWDVMESEGFMLTKVRHREVKVAAVTEMLYILSHDKAELLLQKYLGGRPATAQDMFDAVLQWLEEYRDALGAGHVG
jgi:hypothetical protein